MMEKNKLWYVRERVTSTDSGQVIHHVFQTKSGKHVAIKENKVLRAFKKECKVLKSKGYYELYLEHGSCAAAGDVNRLVFMWGGRIISLEKNGVYKHLNPIFDHKDVTQEKANEFAVKFFEKYNLF